VSEIELSDDPDPRRTKQVIVMHKDLGMRKGKMVAQGAHAATMYAKERGRGSRRPSPNGSVESSRKSASASIPRTN
jgi:peptidyl-tRNA hydrolase